MNGMALGLAMMMSTSGPSPAVETVGAIVAPGAFNYQLATDATAPPRGLP